MSISPTSLTTMVITDLSGITRGRSIPTVELNDYWTSGCGWVPVNASLTPQDGIPDDNPWGCEGDLRLLPDKNSRIQVRNGPDPESPPTDFIHSDIIETDGTPWACCLRTLLRQEIERYRNLLGIQIFAAFEHEFTLKSNKILFEQPAFSLRAQRQTGQFAGWLMAALDAAGVEPEMFLPEYGHGQYEVTCRPTFGVAAADRAINVREITYEIARQMGLQTSFSPQPPVDAESNGVHLHISMKDLSGKQLLYEVGRRYDLSILGEHWAAGVLNHLPALCALTTPTPVSYLRLQLHNWSSAYSCLGNRNREAALRICPTLSIEEKSIGEQYNLEFRPLDATASPHLAMAAILIAGRLGIQRQMGLKAVSDKDPSELSESDIAARGITRLPLNLTSALEIFSKDRELLDELPPKLVETYCGMKRKELDLTAGFTDSILCENYARIY